jgi:cell division protein FtsW
MAGKRKWNLAADPVLLAISLLLVFLGILILASVSASFSLQRFDTTYYYFNHQVIWGLLPGLILGLVAFLMPLELIKRLSLFALLGTIILLVAAFLPFIGTGEGAHRWIFLGPFSFQPSELLKLTFVLYLAALLSSRVSAKKEFGKKSFWEGMGTFLPFTAIVGVISGLLIFQPDVSTLGVVAATGLIMYFVAETPLWHTVFFLGGGLAALYTLIKFEPYRFSRWAVFLDPALDPLGKGYQIKQALIGIGSGGITGIGLGLSFQKFGVLPEPISDSIFAVVAEEMGFLGATLIAVLFLLFAWRALHLARNVEDPFAKLACVGIASWIVLQAFINMGSITGLLPLTGIPLPFISYGGSALVVELIALGILLKLTSPQKSFRMS